MERDIRWIQRFSNYKKALEKLQQSIVYIREDYQNEEDNLDEVLNEMMKEGLIQRFEYTHELAWNVMKDYAYYQGNTEIGGSRDATREAFKMNLIKNGHLWMEMIQNRNRTSHTYDKETAEEIYAAIINQYYDAFEDFKKTMQEKLDQSKQIDLF